MEDKKKKKPEEKKKKEVTQKKVNITWQHTVWSLFVCFNSNNYPNYVYLEAFEINVFTHNNNFVQLEGMFTHVKSYFFIFGFWRFFWISHESKQLWKTQTFCGNICFFPSFRLQNRLPKVSYWVSCHFLFLGTFPATKTYFPLLHFCLVCI